MVKKIYKGNENVYIVATGNSLRGFDFNKFKGLHCIAVNHAFKFLPNFDFLVALDVEFYRDLEKGQPKKTAYTDRCVGDYKGFKGVFLERTGMGGIDFGHGIRTGNNSGYSAIHCAIKAGAKHIYLFGFDMCYENTPHFYDEIGGGERPIYAVPLKYFPELKADLPDDINIYNCSLISKINEFQKINPYDVKFDKYAN